MNRYAIALAILGLGIALIAIQFAGYWLALLWMAANFVLLGIAYFLRLPGIFGKGADGTISPVCWFAFLPYHALSAIVWHFSRALATEPAFNVVSDSLIVSRRLFGSEVPSQFANYVDLTAEFQEPASIRAMGGYVCLPILDATAPELESLRLVIRSLKPGKTLVHCAQGHGRTGLFALALLLTNGRVRDVSEGLTLLQRARPRISMNAEQIACAEAYLRTLEAVPK